MTARDVLNDANKACTWNNYKEVKRLTENGNKVFEDYIKRNRSEILRRSHGQTIGNI